MRPGFSNIAYNDTDALQAELEKDRPAFAAMGSGSGRGASGGPWPKDGPRIAAFMVEPIQGEADP